MTSLLRTSGRRGDIATRTYAVVRWSAVVAMTASAGLHLVVVLAAGSEWSLHALVWLGMGMACLPCAMHLALLPRRRTWVLVSAVSVTMLGLHPLTSALDSGRHSGHEIGAPAGLHVALVVVPGLVLVLALIGYSLHRRGTGLSRCSIASRALIAPTPHHDH